MNIIDGRSLAAQHEEALKEKVKNLGSGIKMVSILIGDDPSSVLYTSMKQRKAADIGINFEPIKFSVDQDFQTVADTISQLNEDPAVSGIMIQLPIPEQFLGSHDWTELPHMIAKEKDVDGLVPGSPFLSATARAVISIIKDERIMVKDKKVVVIGRSDLVGKPVAEKLAEMGAQIEVVHRFTPNPGQICAGADILISATGSPHLVKEDWVKSGAVVIDVGTSELEGKIVGDVDFENVAPKASKITPSPGGVGPMTVISLLENVVESHSWD